jgi:leucyl-tRNA synthetase
MHLLYARFWTKVMRDLGMVGIDEPFSNLLTQGMVCMETRSCPEHGWLYPEEVTGEQCSRCAAPVLVGRIEKMSKSKKNVIDPDGLIARYGADTARLFTLFAAPPEKGLEWNDQGVEGSSRFLHRVWRLVGDHLALVKGAGPVEPALLDEPARDLRRQVHRTIRKVSDDIADRFQFNTAIAAIMELVNAITAWPGKQLHPAVLNEALATVIRLLGPFVPHIAEELWQELGHADGLEAHGWPACDEAALAATTVLIVVQVNGKVRGKVTVPADADDQLVQAAALADVNVARFLEGLTVRKVVVVPGRLVSVVAS